MRAVIRMVVVALLLVAMSMITGCGSGSTAGGTTTSTSLIKNVGWFFDNHPPDYSSDGSTCSLTVTVYYDNSVAVTNVAGFTVISPDGSAVWSPAAETSQFGASSSGTPYISRKLIYSQNTHTFPLAGTWTFQLRLRDGTVSTYQRTFHDPASSAPAVYGYLYTSEDWTLSGTPVNYITALRRFPSDGYSLHYSPENGGSITSTGLAAARAGYAATERRAYNMYCWLYDANRNYLGKSVTQYSMVDHSATNLITGAGELFVAPSTLSGTAVDITQVKYVRFVCLDGAQFAPSSYGTYDYRSVSALIPVVPAQSGSGAPLSLTNLVTTFAGIPLVSGSADGTGTSARFNAPDGITSDGTNLYVTDNINHTIRKIVISSRAVTTIAGVAGVLGAADGIGAAARFHDPLGIATDGANLYVADYGNNTIRKVELSTGLVTTLAGSAGVPGSADGVGSAALFNGPSAITTDGINLYVADTFNNTIRKVVISTGAVTTIAGSAGTQGTADGVGPAASFYWPSGVTSDGANLYISDRGNSRIRKLALATGTVTTFAGGQRGFADGIGSAALFTNPNGIMYYAGSLYVTDYVDNIIRKIDIATATVTTIAGSPGTQGTTDGYGIAARFYWPTDVTTDGRSLFIVDSENNTIRMIQ